MLTIAAHFTEVWRRKKSFLMVMFTKIWLNVAKSSGGHRESEGISFVGKCEPFIFFVGLLA